MTDQPTTSEKLSAREQEEQRIAFSDTDVITRMMQVLEFRGYVDTDWRSENTFEEDVRPLFEKMLKHLANEEKGVEIEIKKQE